MSKIDNPIFKHFHAALLIFAVLIVSPSLAQLNAKYLTQYTELDGLPGIRVSNIVTDKQGYIWIGTINGLARFDGYEFKRYYADPNDSSSMQGLVVWSMFQDHKGQIWIGTSPGNLNVYNPVTQSFRQYNYEKLVDRPVNMEVGIKTIGKDDRGRIYLGVTSYYGEQIETGLLYIDEKDDQVKKYIAPDKKPIQNVISITKDNEGNMWLVSYSGIYKIDTNRNISKMNRIEEVFNKNQEYPDDIKSDKDGHIWFIGYNARLYDYNPVDNSVKTHTPEDKYTGSYVSKKIAFDQNDNIWMGTNTGLIRFNKKTARFNTFKNEPNNQLENFNVESLHFDSFGTLWIGTEASGLLKYEERALFKSFSFNKDDKSSITAGWASTIYETHDGNIWIATSGDINSGGINVFDPKTKLLSSYPFNKFLPGCVLISGMIENKPGELLIATNLGNYLLSVGTKSVRKINLKGVPDNIFINYIFKDSRENLWLCTYTGLFKKDKGTESFKKYDLSSIVGGNAGSNSISRAFESKKHGLWLTGNDGLYLYNYATDKIERLGFDKKEGDIFISQDVNSFYEDASGTAWVGTWGGGLSRYTVETGKIKTYTREDGLPSMSVQHILADEQNKVLWLSTFEGISRFDIATDQFYNYSISDGIQGQLFADGAGVKTSGGLFVFGGSNGVTIFNPTDINTKSMPPKVFLTDLKLSNKSVMPGENSLLKTPIYDTKEIELEYSQNNVSIEFLAIHYSNPSKNRYAYQLENYDPEWRDVGTQNVAYYPNLSPGKYLFRVKAANNNGLWNEEGASLKIVINPPWWNTFWAYGFYLILFVLAIFAADRYFRSRVIQKERERNRTRELEQAKEIEKAYVELKATQSQLIQSEKMASLGELTAGIAHEIQNPLNFVNNFSEVNTELIQEMKEEIEKGNLDEVKTLANDISENEQKINHHGKRADAIVKGMLQHSRSSNGIKEPTNINVLADEYFRLAYHGLRAKDKSFNATMKTDFDKTIGNINIIPQDIGRVILNLITNAFYAVNEKKHQHAKDLSGLNDYEPTVWVGTKRTNDKVVVFIKDNGIGISKSALDKIFQPFFTTKPTGQGTGLGLSLAYDIVKAHGGELRVETKEGDGSEFIIQLPVV